MKEKYWILESAILLALATGIFYSFGHYYDYRMRFEFNIQTITLGVSPETLIHDGATIAIAWIGTTKEFWVALSLFSVVTIIFVFLNRGFQKVSRPAVVSVTFIFGLIVLYLSVISYIPSRAHFVAGAIEKLAIDKRQSLAFKNDEMIEGYTIIGTPSKVAFLTHDNKVFVVQYAEIKRIDAAR